MEHFRDTFFDQFYIFYLHLKQRYIYPNDEINMLIKV